MVVIDSGESKQEDVVKGRVRVNVGPGVFSSERAAWFMVGDTTYSVLVDQAEIEGDLLTVYVVGRRGTDAVIELPSESPNAGRRIVVPSDLVLAA
jgi:hypothetical protein